MRCRGGSRSRRRARRSSPRPATPAPRRAARIGTSRRPTAKRLSSACTPKAIDLVVLGPEVGDRRRRRRPVARCGHARSSVRTVRAGGSNRARVFAKRFMERHGVPTARARRRAFARAARTRRSTSGRGGGVVVKADGLAAGKGVVVCDTRRRCARACLRDWYGKNAIPGGGSDVLLEERLEGREVSVFALARRARDGAARRGVRLQARRRRRHRPEHRRHGRLFAAARLSRRPVRSRARAHSRAGAARTCSPKAKQYIGVLYCGLMWTDGRPVGHRVQRALRRSRNASVDAAHQRRFCRVAQIVRRRRDGSELATFSDAGVRRRRARDERLSAQQHAACGTESRRRARRRRAGVLGRKFAR